ncbi:hypothetical protein [Bradyrhizobium sp. 25ACV]
MKQFSSTESTKMIPHRRPRAGALIVTNNDAGDRACQAHTVPPDRAADFVRDVAHSSRLLKRLHLILIQYDPGKIKLSVGYEKVPIIAF